MQSLCIRRGCPILAQFVSGLAFVATGAVVVTGLAGIVVVTGLTTVGWRGATVVRAACAAAA